MAGETAERSRVIDAPPAAVWALVGDVTRMPEWSEELASVELLEGDGRSPGSRFRGNNAADGRPDWSMTCVVDEHVEGRRLAFHTENDKGEERTRWWYALAPERGGEATLVTEGFYRVAKVGRIKAALERKLIGDRTELNIRNIEASLARLAALVES